MTLKAPHSTLHRQLLIPLLAWKAKKQRKPLLIDGARQTGKTWLLKNLLGAEFDRALHLDFLENPGLAEAFADSLAPNDLISNIELQTGQPFNPATDLLILDEIGECPQAVTSLKYFAEQAPDWHVAASGSNIGLLSSFPVGQVEQHNLRPMTFGEFIQASDDAALIQAFETQANTAAAHGRLWDQLTDYYFTGGMPEAVANWFGHSSQGGLERAEAVRKIQQDLIEGYRRDFGKYGKTDAQLIGAVFNSIPAQLSNVVNESVNRFRFKGVHPGKSRYANFESAIDWLHQSRLALKNYPLEGELKPPLAAYRKENMVKLFMFDVGLLNVMLGTSYREIKQQGCEYKGYVAENFVQQELAAMGLEPGYSWHGARAEIEFVFSDDGGQVIPVEVKSGQRTRSKSLQTYVQKYQPRKSFKLTGTRGSDGKGESGSPTVLPLYYVTICRSLFIRALRGSNKKEVMMVTSNTIKKVWDKAKKIRGKDPQMYRQDTYGNTMYWYSYGKDTDMGWEIDHIKPKNKGGSDAVVNLQALNTRVNRSKGDSLKKRNRHSKSNK